MTTRRTTAASSFTLVELLVILAVLAAFAFVVLPGLAKAKARAQRIGCVSRLKQIGLSFRIWSMDHTNLNPMSVSTTFGGTREHIETGEVFRHFQVMSNELNTPVILACPSDRNRRSATDFTTTLSNSNVSYFLGLDTDETQPQMLLAGDSNLEVDGKPVGPGLLTLYSNSAVGWTTERHVRQGNVALADGSVQQYSSARLRDALRYTGVATNRLAIP